MPENKNNQTALVAGVTAPKSFADQVKEALQGKTSRGGSGGVKIRPNVSYALTSVAPQKLANLKSVPLQKAVLINLFLAVQTPEKPKISEPELHAIVTAAVKSGTLKTKQDPWRIFQYYRTGMITEGILTEHAA